MPRLPIRARIVSDIHLEFHRSVTPMIELFKSLDPADMLILAGDISTFSQRGRLTEFLCAIAPQYRKILYVLGNHEYYDSPRPHAAMIDHITDFLPVNAQILENELYVDPETNVKIYGTTLWSNITDKGYDKMNDRFHIRINEYRDKHQIARAKLQELAVGECDLIVTHHLPSQKLVDPKYLKYGADIQSAYSSDCDDLLDRTARFWVHGHTHEFGVKELDGRTFIANPMGYPHEQKKRMFTDIVIEL